MIHVCYGLYDRTGRYSKFTGTSMLSLFDNTKSEVTVHILHDKTLSEENKIKLQRVAENFHQQIKFYNVEELCAEKISEFMELIPSLNYSTFTVGCMYRLLISYVIPAEFEKVIYLDSDTIVNLDINELWSIELGEKPLAALPEIENKVEVALTPLIRFYGLINVEDYFNSGVLLINLNSMKNFEQDIRESIRFIGQKEKLKLPDQDVLNYCFATKILRLPSVFNEFVDHARLVGNTSIEKKIYHYIGNALTFDMCDNFNRLWMEYFFKTPWMNTEIIHRIFVCVQELNNQSQNKLLELSAVMSGKRRIFFAELENFEGFKKLFKIKKSEEIIDGTKHDAIKILLRKMKKFRGIGYFILLVHDFEALKKILAAEKFVEGEDFADATEFLSTETGKNPLDTYFLIRAI